MRLIESIDELHLTEGSREKNISTLELLGFRGIEYSTEDIPHPHAIVAMVDEVIVNSDVFHTFYLSELGSIEKLVQFPPDIPSHVIISTNTQRYTNQVLLKYTGNQINFGRTSLFSVARKIVPKAHIEILNFAGRSKEVILHDAMAFLKETYSGTKGKLCSGFGDYWAYEESKVDLTRICGPFSGLNPFYMAIEGDQAVEFMIEYLMGPPSD